VAWPEVFTALQTGVVNGQENPILQIYEGKLYEVQKFVMMTEHISSYFHWVANEKFLQGLSPDNRKLVESVVKGAADWAAPSRRKVCRAARRSWRSSTVSSSSRWTRRSSPRRPGRAIERIADQQWAPEVKGLLKEIGAW